MLPAFFVGASVAGEKQGERVWGDVERGVGGGSGGVAGDAGEVDEGTVAYVDVGDGAAVDGVDEVDDGVGGAGDVDRRGAGDACGGEDVGGGERSVSRVVSSRGQCPLPVPCVGRM